MEEVAAEMLEAEADKELAKWKPSKGVVVSIQTEGRAGAGIRVKGGGGESVVIVGDGNTVAKNTPEKPRTARKVELTLEGFDPQLADAVQRYADAKGMTWEEAANVLLKAGLDYARKMQGEFRKAKTAKPKKPAAKAD